MKHNKVHHRGYIATTYGKKSLVIQDEVTGKEAFHTGFYTGDGSDEDLKSRIDSLIDELIPIFHKIYGGCDDESDDI